MIFRKCAAFSDVSRLLSRFSHIFARFSRQSPWRFSEFLASFAIPGGLVPRYVLFFVPLWQHRFSLLTIWAQRGGKGRISEDPVLLSASFCVPLWPIIIL